VQERDVRLAGIHEESRRSPAAARRRSTRRRSGERRPATRRRTSPTRTICPSAPSAQLVVVTSRSGSTSAPAQMAHRRRRQDPGWSGRTLFPRRSPARRPARAPARQDETSGHRHLRSCAGSREAMCRRAYCRILRDRIPAS
jgi:hypothetical protein